MKDKIEQKIREALGELGAGEVNFVVERPRDMAHGDYATNAALVGKVDPQKIAEKLSIDGVERIEVVGKFINFFLTREALKEEASAATKAGWGRNELYKGKKVM